MRQLFICLLLLYVCTGCKRIPHEQEPLLPTGALLLADTDAWSPSWSKDNMLSIQVNAEPDNLHPTNGNSSLRGEILQLTQIFLVSNRFGTSLETRILTGLPPISADGLTYTFELRTGLKWPDGKPITTDDIAFTCKVNASGLAENAAGLPYWSRLAYTSQQSVTRISLTMLARNTNDIAFLASFPLLQRTHYDPRNILGDFDLKELRSIARSGIDNPSVRKWFDSFNRTGAGNNPEKLHCTGDYNVSEWSPGRHIVLTKRKAIPFDGPNSIVYRFNRDENSMLIGLHDQIYDLSASVGSGAFRQALEDPLINRDYRLVLVPTYNYSYLCFNMRPDASGRPAFFNDKNTRKAFAALVPAEEIIRLVYGEQSDRVPRMASYVSPLKQDFDTTLQPVRFDMKNALSLLTKAGWNDYDQDGILERSAAQNSSIPFEPELLYLNASSDWKAIAELITAAAEKAGINVKSVAVDPATFTVRARKHDFDILLGSWGGNALPEDPMQLWGTASWAGNGSNYSGFGTSATDSLIETINSSDDPTERKLHTVSLQRMIAEEQPYVFLYNSMRRMIIHRRWSNVTVYPDRPGYLPDNWHLRSNSSQ